MIKRADSIKEIIILSDACGHVTSFFVLNATRRIAIATILRPKSAPFAASTNCIGPLPAHTQIAGRLVHSMSMLNIHLMSTMRQHSLSSNHEHAKIYLIINTPKIPRITVGWAAMVKIGHIMGYQIEADKISDSKSSLDLP